MELRHIRYFLAVAEEMNFTRAAEKLMIAQPPLSRQIMDLEAELGAPLFLRSPHKLRITEEGILFRQYAQQIVDLADKAVDEVKQIHEGLHGTLFIGTVEGNAPYLLSEWISGFHKLHPHVQYDIWNGNSDDISLRVNRGLCELGLVMSPYNTEELNGCPVYDEPWVAIMSEEHPMAAEPGNTISLEMLGRCDLLVPSRQSRQMEIGNWFSAIGQAPHIICRISNTINALDLAERNVGVAIYPASHGNGLQIPQNAQARHICIKEIDVSDIRARYVLVRAKNRSLSRVAGEFNRYVRDSVQHHTTENDNSITPEDI